MKLTKQEIAKIRDSSVTCYWDDSILAFAENIQSALLKKLQTELEQATLYRWLRDRPYKYKFSLPNQNAFVMKLTGMSGKELGAFMTTFKSKFSKDDMSKMTAAMIREELLREYAIDWF